MFEINNKDTRRMLLYRCDAFIVNFEHTSHLSLMFLFWILIM